MVILHDNTTDPDSTATASDDRADSPEDNSGVLSRLSSLASKVSDVIDPFVNVLTLVVHGFTVWKLAREA